MQNVKTMHNSDENIINIGLIVDIGSWEGKFSNSDENIINIGLIVDIGSWEGKVIHTCITMAISDFYNLNSQYKTRIALQVRDSRGDSFHSIASALDLLENVGVRGLIIPKVSNVDLFLATLGDKANVPVLSLSSTPSADEHPYFLQVEEDETTQFHGIAALVEAFKWRSCVILYEDTADARQVQSYVYNIMQETHMDIVHQAALNITPTDDQIEDELHKLLKMKTSIIIMHMPPSLTYQVLEKAKRLGMMSQGFAWIITSKTMNLLESQNSSVYEAMQGIIGFKSYIPASRKLQNFTLRWRREFQHVESNMETRDLNVFGLRAYDAVWALAEAVERTGIKPSPNRGQSDPLDLARLTVSSRGPTLLSNITGSKFMGLAGDFQLTNRKLVHETYEIVNVIGKGERRVGFWTPTYGLANDIRPPRISSSNYTLEPIIWPGFSITAPKSWLVQMSGKGYKVGIPPGYMPELVAVHHDQQTNVTTFSGFCVDVFRAAVDKLAYDISFEFVPFYNQSYWDLIYQVHLQTYDAAVGDITILANRSAYVDFTLPFTESGPGIIAKLDDKDPWFFLRPLNPDLWILSACLFLLMGFVVWLIEHPDNEEFQGSPAWKIGTIFWFAISTLVYAHSKSLFLFFCGLQAAFNSPYGEKLKHNLSRFVVGVWLFVVLILTSSYTANLSSLLTVKQIKLTKGDYIGSANSFVQGLTMSNLNFRDDRLKPFRSTDEYDEALTRGSKNGGVHAIIEEIPYIKIFLSKYPNKYTMIDSSMKTSGFGFAFPKGSPLVHEISRGISELREEGKLLEMEKKWLTNRSPLLSQDTQQLRASTLGIGNFFGLFIVSGISKLIAIIVLCIFLLGERLSNIYLMLRVLAAGELIFMLRYLSPRMAIRVGRFIIR
ncbi:hypothetical protein BUALT_Bualt02G0166800 [Buddleja alternifolia]|uniref:Glutamate receptor n=1 Tax=Buddleja alternifolia TaxID=168488 RepID=A0AAV6YBK6_9LAMI|nr:hypothetical protein BUALT_Bualt02G0166800 [Buddleja alternifolia]